MRSLSKVSVALCVIAGGLAAIPSFASLRDLLQAPTFTRLSETGLYADIATRTLAPDLIPYEPTHELWSDGAAKARWIRLPAGMPVDTTDMDRWQVPVGTQVFKEFSFEGRPVETRLIQRYGPAPEEFWMGSFVWLPDGSDAVLAPEGRTDLNGTSYDVPSQLECMVCHRGEPGRLLGFSAVQLSRTPGPSPSGALGSWTLTDLANAGLLSVPPPPGVSYPVPGDAVTAPALGYLHANCAHCHSATGVAFPLTNLDLRVSSAEQWVSTTGAYRTAVDQPLDFFVEPGFVYRVRPGFPEESALFFRMQLRGPIQMPPALGTDIVDPAGLELVAAWIRSLR